MLIKRRNRNNFVRWLLEPFTSQRGPAHHPDYGFLIMLAMILFFGLLFLSSASSTLSFFRYHDSYRLVKQQITHGLLPGLLLFYILFRIDYKFYKKISWLWLLGSLLLLVLGFFSKFAGGFGTAQSWIQLGPITFQPSEFVKLFLILWLATWLEPKGKAIKDFKTTTLPLLILLAILGFLLLKQPDVGTFFIICFVALVMWFGAGAAWKHLILVVGAGVVAFVAMIKAAPYRLDRFSAWLNPNFDPQGIGWQIQQALVAIGSGGWFGLGLGASRQKSYLPWPANDSIFAVMAEEIGFVFMVGFLLLVAALIYRCFYIMRNSQDNFAKLIVLGIVAWFGIQVFVNIGGMMNLMPLTGVPLPLVSLGGSNLVATLAALGILANISRFTAQS